MSEATAAAVSATDGIPCSHSHRAARRHATKHLHELLARFSRDPRAIDVSFRELVGPIPVNDLGHSLYPYPARLLRQIPRFFLNCEQLVQPGDVVVDPFCGSGTVLVEARAAGISSWGIDSNPFARLLSAVKTTPLDKHQVALLVRQVTARAKVIRSGAVPDVVNVDLWYSGPVKRALARLRRAILEVDCGPEYKRFLLVCLAVTADECSLRDPRIPVPVRQRDWEHVRAAQRPGDALRVFDVTASIMGSRLSALPQSNATTLVLGNDARAVADLYADWVQGDLQRPAMVLTSPPYGAAQKYVRSSSLALGWTGLAPSAELADLERMLIGREHVRKTEVMALSPGEDAGIPDAVAQVAKVDATRAAIYTEYFRAMDTVFAQLQRLLRPGGVLVLVAGSNTVAGRTIDTHAHLRDAAIRHGFSPRLELRDTIRGRVLLTKRASKSTPLRYESIHVLQKAGE
jgi:hypothetical protein